MEGGGRTQRHCLPGTHSSRTVLPGSPGRAVKGGTARLGAQWLHRPFSSLCPWTRVNSAWGLERMRWSEVMVRQTVGSSSLKRHRSRDPGFWIQNRKHSQPDTREYPHYPRNWDCSGSAVGMWDGSRQPQDPVARQIISISHTCQRLNSVTSASVEGSLWAAQLREAGIGSVSPEEEEASFIRWLTFSLFPVCTWTCPRLNSSETVTYFSVSCCL